MNKASASFQNINNMFVWKGLKLFKEICNGQISDTRYHKN